MKGSGVFYGLKWSDPALKQIRLNIGSQSRGA